MSGAWGLWAHGHAGIAAANTLLDTYPDQEVVMIDRNTNLSYFGCGTALWVGRQIDSVDKLFYTNKDAFEAKGAQVFMGTEVTSIDFDAHLVSCRPRTGADFTIKYDKLVLATGSLPIAPKLPGQAARPRPRGHQFPQALPRGSRG